MIEENGHTVMSGELYLEVYHFQKEALKKHCVIPTSKEATSYQGLI